MNDDYLCIKLKSLIVLNDTFYTDKQIKVNIQCNYETKIRNFLKCNYLLDNGCDFAAFKDIITKENVNSPDLLYNIDKDCTVYFDKEDGHIGDRGLFIFVNKKVYNNICRYKKKHKIVRIGYNSIINEYSIFWFVNKLFPY
jgi:hypothetical protein